MSHLNLFTCVVRFIGLLWLTTWMHCNLNKNKSNIHELTWLRRRVIPTSLHVSFVRKKGLYLRLIFAEIKLSKYTCLSSLVFIQIKFNHNGIEWWQTRKNRRTMCQYRTSSALEHRFMSGADFCVFEFARSLKCGRYLQTNDESCWTRHLSSIWTNGFLYKQSLLSWTV